VDPSQWSQKTLSTSFDLQVPDLRFRLILIASGAFLRIRLSVYPLAFGPHAPCVLKASANVLGHLKELTTVGVYKLLAEGFTEDHLVDGSAIEAGSTSQSRDGYLKCFTTTFVEKMKYSIQALD
jgi:hypothetical protein